jgi:tripartite-type tricarboxylate transporter receptor subunit TctC
MACRLTGLAGPADQLFRALAESASKDLVAKKNPGKVNYGSTGTGTSPHPVIEEISATAGIQLTHVPSRPPAPARSPAP